LLIQAPYCYTTIIICSESKSTSSLHIFNLRILFMSFLIINGFSLILNLKLGILIGIDMEFLLDIWSLSFSLLVLIVSTIVIVFCYMYIKDMLTNVFIVLYLLFVFRMQFLIYRNRFY